MYRWKTRRERTGNGKEIREYIKVNTLEDKLIKIKYERMNVF
jgi:hypothetical protein